MRADRAFAEVWPVVWWRGAALGPGCSRFRYLMSLAWAVEPGLTFGARRLLPAGDGRAQQGQPWMFWEPWPTAGADPAQQRQKLESRWSGQLNPASTAQKFKQNQKPVALGAT